MSDERFCYWVGLAAVALSTFGPELRAMSELRAATVGVMGIVLLCTSMILKAIRA